MTERIGAEATLTIIGRASFDDFSGDGSRVNPFIGMSRFARLCIAFIVWLLFIKTKGVPSRGTFRLLKQGRRESEVHTDSS